jgi:multiple sugar transport system ATP-binding protein
MNFIPAHAALARGATQITVAGAHLQLPALQDDLSARALLYGVRPEHVRLQDDAPLRAEVQGVEYLGNCQIVTLKTAQDSVVRAKIDVHTVARRGDQTGLVFDSTQITLFDQSSGRAIRTARDALPLAGAARTGAAHG